MRDYSIKLSITTHGKGNICKTVAEYGSNFEQIPCDGKLIKCIGNWFVVTCPLCGGIVYFMLEISQ